MKKIKILLSCAIVFHLWMVVVIPNGDSYFVYTWGKMIYPYVSTLGIGSSWQFFSPDPAPAVYYEIRALQAGEEIASTIYPNESEQPWFRPNVSRRNSVKNIFMRYPKYTTEVLVPYFCRQYPQADLISIRKKMLRSVSYVAAIEGQALNDRNWATYEEIGEEYCENP